MTPIILPVFPKGFHIWILFIHFYALAYIIALLIGWKLVDHLAKKPPVSASSLQIDDFLTWATLGIILGGRLGYVCFYQPLFFLTHPIKILEVWDGGMSFHGGFIGVMTAIILFCRREHIVLLRFADRIAVAAPIGLFLGRCANFINGELWGRPAPPGFPFAMVYPADPAQLPRFPSELIEASLEGIVLFLILITAVQSQKLRDHAGVITGIFVLGYGLARITSEFFREPDAFLGFLPFGTTMGQILSLPMLLAGAGLIIWGRAIKERFDAFMARANAAYYATQNPFADFCTAPELTQVFGELLGAWAKTVWQMLGSPADIILAEAGPGTGALMADALRVWPAPNVHLIETSPRLRALQAEKIPHATWHRSLATIPRGPMILLANEFLDALPVRQFIRRPNGWFERYVENGAYVEQPTDANLPGDPPGTIRETNEHAKTFVKQLAARNAVGLFIDYGYTTQAPGTSVQAIRQGAYADPLAAPGTSDLTAHVNFAALAQCAHTQGPVPQHRFLSQLGLLHRTNSLAAKNPGKARALNLAAWRLTAPEAMGTLFKVLAVCPKALPTLPGFEP